MEAYTAFALVYDKFMENVPYDLWGTFLDVVISKYGVSRPFRDAIDALESERNLVLDLGCGTGILTKIMYDKGYDLMGVDVSTDMLDEARKILDSEVLLLCQDMCDLDLYSTVGTIYAACDTINYLLEDEEIEECFGKVANYLYPGGIFVFDINTIHKYQDVIGEATIAENAEDSSFIWENYFDKESCINEIDLTLFIKDEKSGMFNKNYEEHYQRGYTYDEIREFLENVGLELIMAIDEELLEGFVHESENMINDDGPKCTGETGESVINISDESERIFFVARKCE